MTRRIRFVLQALLAVQALLTAGLIAWLGSLAWHDSLLGGLGPVAAIFMAFFPVAELPVLVAAIVLAVVRGVPGRLVVWVEAGLCSALLALVGLIWWPPNGNEIVFMRPRGQLPQRRTGRRLALHG